MNYLADGLDVVNSSQNVAGVCAGDQSRLFSEQPLELLCEQLGLELGGGLPPLDDELLAFSEVEPWCNVGLVVDC